MNESRKASNVEARLRQQVLSGWSDYGKPEGYSHSDEKTEPQPKTPANFWQQKSYIAFIPVIIEPTGICGDGNEYSIQIANDVDIPLHTFSRRGKSVSKQAISIPGKKGKAAYKIPVVYGIQSDGNDTLSHPTGYTTVQAVANTYSSFLGKVATTLKCMLLNAEGQEKSSEDTGKRNQGTQPPEDLGKSTPPGRGGKVRAKIRDEAVPEEPAKLDETYREILGDRPRDISDKLAGMGNVRHLGEEP